MKNFLSFFVKMIGLLGGLFLLYIGVTLVHGTLTDYQPEDVLPAKVENNGAQAVIEDSTLSFVIWNVGYGGLGAESNFFYDDGSFFFSNGKMIASPKNLVDKNIDGAEQFLQTTKADFFMLQEVDYNSARSYYINQFEEYKDELPNYSSSFAPNYQVARVPLPILEPWRAYGKTLSGLATYARFQPAKSTRLQLPGKFDWPTRIFQLDRCMLEQRFEMKNGKELLVYNIHNSAYDKSGELKKQQLAFLQQIIMKEYQQGNYIVVGGDWNQCPPNFAFDSLSEGDAQGYSQINIPADFVPADWVWAYDPTLATNRKVRDVYDEKETFKTLIDFYLVSPNLKVRTVKGINQNFQFSDHQPVYLEVEVL